MREECLRCRRPTAHCLCDILPSFAAQNRITILQHPLEFRRYYSTVRLLHRAIQNAELFVANAFPEPPGMLAQNTQSAFLLFPDDEAVFIDDVELKAHNELILIDGTWREARQILRNSPWLARVPRLSLRHPGVTQYKVRKAPRAGYISSLESLCAVLSIDAQRKGEQSVLEGCRSLYEAFQACVSKQAAFSP